MIKKLRSLIVIGGLMATILTGCGSGSSSNSSTSGTAETGESLSRQFAGPNGENKVATFGAEASQDAVEQASAVVASNLEARAARDWAGQCSTLSTKAARVIAESAVSKGPKSCPAQLGAQGREAPAAVLADNLEGSVAVLRVKGSTGYALYHGNDDKDWAMPMEKESGEWKVASLVAEELPR